MHVWPLAELRRSPTLILVTALAVDDTRTRVLGFVRLGDESEGA
ncbi:hypothetical protein PI125_g16044 [Phytophthora idaei]|nr:hypothetical protein PI125_g16044 [Phytophthora idaei]